MKSAGREWAIIAAFILFMIFGLSQHAFMTIASAGYEKTMKVFLLGLTGSLAGVLILPLLLPLKYLRFGKRPPRYKLRLTLTAVFFLPNIIFRLLGQDAWLGNPVNSSIMALGNGVVTTLMYGCVFSLIGKNRVFWPALAFSVGIIVFHLALSPEQPLLAPYLFAGSGFALTIAGILLFVFLCTIPGTIPAGGDAKSDPPPDKSGVEAGAGAARFVMPLYIFPILATLVIFLTNSLTDQLFLPVLNTPFSPGFHLPVLVMILALPLLGFLAGISWERFIQIFIPLCSLLFLLAPSLLLFNSSQPLFQVLYVLNTVAIRMITAVFPYITVELYWKQQNYRPRLDGYWGWLLSVSILLVHTSMFIPSVFYRFISIDNAHAVILLTLAAIVFSFLSRKIFLIQKRVVAAPLQSASLINILGEYKLTDRETEVALLMLQEGLSNEEMGKRLYISLTTIKSHVSQIYRKLGVKSRAAFWAKCNQH